MPPALRTDTIHDIAADVNILTLRGVLDMGTAPAARDALANCLAECPTAVVVDLRPVEVRQPLALTVFRSTVHAWHRPGGAGHPAVAVLLAVAPEVSRLARACIGDLPLTDTPEAAIARAGVIRKELSRMSLALRPDADAPRRARELVASACAAWGVEQVSREARLIASELVTNAVEHAGSAIEVEVINRAPYLHIRVRDASSALPWMRSAGPRDELKGRGLYLVDVYSGHWGVVSDDGGKVVWATLRTRPVGPG
jgi:anti-sigma regulatory factor (Ser/Thr protein kinase)